MTKIGVAISELPKGNYYATGSLRLLSLRPDYITATIVDAIVHHNLIAYLHTGPANSFEELPAQFVKELNCESCL
jgi:hypothetical protein